MMRLCPIKYGVKIIDTGEPTYAYKYYFFEWTSSYWSKNGNSPADVETITPTVMPLSQDNNKKSNTGGVSLGTTLIHLHSSKKPYVSTDSGATWFESTWPEGSSIEYTASIYSGGYYWLQSASHVLYKTTDFVTWSGVTTIPYGTRSSLVNIGDLIVSVGDGAVNTSIDGGLNWTETRTNVGSNGQVGFTDGTAFIITPANAPTSGGFKRSTNGTTWTVLTGVPSRGSSSEIVHSCAGGGVWLIFFGGTYLRSLDSGATWTAYTLPSSRVAQCSVFADGEHIVGTSENKMLVSSDGIAWSEYTPLSRYGGGFSAIIVSKTEV